MSQIINPQITRIYTDSEIFLKTTTVTHSPLSHGKIENMIRPKSNEKGANMKIWMAIVIEENEEVFRRAYQSEREAETAIIEYLQKNKDYESDDFSYVFFWIGEQNLNLNSFIFEMVLENFESQR